MIEGWPKSEVEPGQVLNGGEPCSGEGDLEPTRFAQRQLLGQDGVNRLQGAPLVTFELVDDGTGDLQGARQAWAHHFGLDAVEHTDGQVYLGLHHACPFSASTRLTAS